ncbi:hypothetical protein DEU34_2270 [Microbacterium sp. AG1240]|uniref:hypothetical protein n=1 Tax=Microbacterium sp. AG1240 TaxID=2183992 RepID=UPI000F17A0FF|nr:hypothetical protein [Microbacterium sp. AG1240]RKT33666.1 hypothetical protein DEU34_2270 [Microbacterium sp. AG1240]
MTSNRTSVLRAVVPGEVPASLPVLSLDQAIKSGSYVQILIAQRVEMVTALPETKGPALAALHRQISLTSKEIEALLSRDSDESEGGANVDDGEFDAEAI